MKKLFSVIIALILCALILPAAVTADDNSPRTVESDGFVFSIQNDEASLVSYTGKETEVVIPESVEGCSVTHIGYGVFQVKRKEITSVVIPDTVTSIKEGAFSGCVKMSSVVLSKNLTEIAPSAFSSCSLESVTIPGNVKKIGEFAFVSCRQLETLVIEEGVTLIDDEAFSDCEKLKSVFVPGSVKTIGKNAFCDCASLESVTLGEGVETLGLNAFRGCSLRSFYLPKSIKSIAVDVVMECPNLTKLNYAGDRADWDKVTVSHANEDLFALEIEFKDGSSQPVSETNPVISYPSFSGKMDMFYYSSENGEVTITGFDPDQNDPDKDYALVIPSQISGYPVKTIAKNALSLHPTIHVVSVTIADGVETIGDCAFYGNRYLTSVSIPKSVTSIGKSAFADCGSIKTFVLDPANPAYTFTGNCLIEKSTKTLLSGFKNPVIPSDGSVETIADQAFYRREGLTEVTVPSGVKTIGWEAFYECPLVSAKLSDGLVSIGDRAFGGCEKLEKIVIPDSVKTIGDGAFNCNYALKSVKLPAGLERIGEAMFSKCRSLTSIEIPSGVTRIGAEAFYKCEALTEIKLPAGLKTVSIAAFLSCGKLAKVNFAGSEKEWKSVSVESDNGALLNAKIIFNSADKTQPAPSSAAASTAKKTEAPASTAKKTEAPVSTKAQESTVPATASVTEAPASSADPTEEAAQSTVPAGEAPGSTAPVSEKAAQISADPAPASTPASSVKAEDPAASVPQTSNQPEPQNDPTVWIVVGAVAVALGAGAFFVVRKLRRKA